MNNILFLKNKKIINTINSFSGQIVIFGYSSTTLNYISKIKKQNIIIVDNNENLHNTKLDNYIIIHPEKIKELENILVVVWGNYCKDQLKQLQSYNIKNIIIDIDNGGLKVLSKKFIIEIPPYLLELKAKLGAQHKFILKFIQQLALMQIPFETKVISEINIDKEYKLADDEIVISYHTKGSEIKNLYRYKESYLPNYISFDTMGFSGWHSICKLNISNELEKITLNKANIFYQKLYKKYVKNNKSKYTQPSNDKLKLPKKYIFFPLQISTDVVTELASVSQEDVLNKLINIFKKTETFIVVKKHPKCNDIKLNELLNKLAEENEIILFSGSIHRAIEKSISVITSNSGVGFEALLHLKNVITFGKSEYMSMTNNISNLEELNKTLFSHTKNKYKHDIKRFLYYLLKKQCLNDKIKFDKFIKNLILYKTR